jgi:hypothetical protein
MGRGMAASPGRAIMNMNKKAYEANYVAILRDIPIIELTNLLSIDHAGNIAKLADNNIDFYDSVPRESEEIKFNTSIYKDEIEDFIDCLAVRSLVDASRKRGDHRSAENVRILRSARAVIYYSQEEKE